MVDTCWARLAFSFVVIGGLHSVLHGESDLKPISCGAGPGSGHLSLHQLAWESTSEQGDLVFLGLSGEVQETPLLKKIGLDGLARLQDPVHGLFQVVVDGSLEAINHSCLDLSPRESCSDWRHFSDQPLHCLV